MWRLVLMGAAIALITFLAYLPALRGGYIWDDDFYVTANHLLTAPDGLKQIWFSLNSPSQYFPLTYTVLRLEHAYWGPDPLGYHVVNVLLHIMNALLLWVILRRLSLRGAWLATAIFALHPVNVESVAWVTELKNVLSTLFYLLTVLVWLRFTDPTVGAKRRDYLLSLVFCALALFAKTTACTIPAVLLIVLWVRRERIDRARVLQIIPFALMSVAMALVSVWWEQNHQGTTGVEFALSPVQRVLIASRAYWFYLGKLVWPAKLCFSYPKWHIDASDPVQYVWLIAIIAAAVVLWIGRRTWSRGSLIAGVFFGVVLSPMLGFVSLYTFRYTYVADHYQYLACAAPIALVAGAIDRIRPAVLRIGVPAVLLAVLGVLTWTQGSIYRDAETLWRDTVAKNPSSSMAHNNLAVIHGGRGDAIEAEKESREAIRCMPDNADAHYNLALALAAQEHLTGAAEQYEIVLRLKPGHSEAHNNFGIVLMRLGEPDQALTEFRAAVKANGTNVEAILNLARALRERQELDEAVGLLRRAVRLEPYSPNTHGDLASALYAQRDYAGAAEELRLCEQYGGSMPDLAATLARTMR